MGNKAADAFAGAFAGKAIDPEKPGQGVALVEVAAVIAVQEMLNLPDCGW